MNATCPNCGSSKIKFQCTATDIFSTVWDCECQSCGHTWEIEE